VKTGRILVAAEAPTMDPNAPGKSPESDRHARIFESQFEPGSVIKAITAASLIETGKATPEAQVVAPYGWTVPKSGGYRVTDSHAHGDDKLTLTGVLRDSSNTGIMRLGQRVDVATRFDILTKFGMGKKTAINFPGESSGIVLPFNEWDNIKKYVSMFGQGFSVTPIQSAMMYQAIANNGVRLQPRLVEGCEDGKGNFVATPKQPGVQAISSVTARTTIDMLEKVVEQGGIGRHAAVPGYRVAGKTGTAQITDPNTGRYGNLHAISFIGMAPAENPQYVVAVTAYKSRTVTNSLGATPIFKAIMQQVLRTYRVPPSTTKSANIATEWK
jgi:cell division protein FtsI (penicillin-binding protein 3)